MITIQRCNVLNGAYQRVFNCAKTSGHQAKKQACAGIQHKSLESSLGKTTLCDVLLFPYHLLRFMCENLSKMCE